MYVIAALSVALSSAHLEGFVTIGGVNASLFLSKSVETLFGSTVAVFINAATGFSLTASSVGLLNVTAVNLTTFPTTCVRQMTL